MVGGVGALEVETQMGGAKTCPSFWVPEPGILRGVGKAGSTVKCRVKFLSWASLQRKKQSRSERKIPSLKSHLPALSRGGLISTAKWRTLSWCPEGTGRGSGFLRPSLQSQPQLIPGPRRQRALCRAGRAGLNPDGRSPSCVTFSGLCSCLQPRLTHLCQEGTRGHG